MNSLATASLNTQSSKSPKLTPIASYKKQRKRSSSPSHIPQTASEEEAIYVLTLLTDKAHHIRMTELRRRYFPTKLNKLAAHLTFFHALPGSRLETDVLPVLEDVASNTQPFKLVAEEPFRLKRGFAVSISRRYGGIQAKQVHNRLQENWKRAGFLSGQDAGGCQIHYTLMNKIDDEAEVEKAYSEFCDHWRPDSGTAEGFALWLYDRGFWRSEKIFPFDRK